MQAKFFVEHYENCKCRTRDGVHYPVMRWELYLEQKNFRSHIIYGVEHYRDLIEALHELLEGDTEILLEWWDDWDDVEIRWRFVRQGESMTFYGSKQPSKKELRVFGTYSEICLPF